MKRLVPFEKASETLSKYTDESLMIHQKVEHIPLWEAGGRVLAADITAREDIPAFHRSHVDGYAFISSDVAAAGEANPVTLPVIDTIAAGSCPAVKLLRGTAMKIFTGAPLPPEADCIIKKEETEEISSESGPAVIIKRYVFPGECISRRGEDARAGEALYPAGRRISFPETEILATLGIDPVPVYARPQIGVFSTGNELVGLHEDQPYGKLRASNLYTLAELIRLAGGAPVNLGIAPDRLEEVLHVYEQADRLHLPLVISTGGTASGDLDYIKNAMDLANSSRLFDKVGIRPGAPFVASVKENQLLVGLSGNPGGAIVAFLLLLLPLISRLEGAEKELTGSRGRLTAPIVRKGGLRGFFWGNYNEQNGYFDVTPFGNQYCGAMQTHITSNCLIELPAGKVNLSHGDEVKIWKLPS